MPLLLPITKPNSGHGATCLYGYRYAIEHGAEYIFQTDSDGQTLPGEFEGFWSMREDYDAVLGKRSNRQDGISRKFVENVLRFILFVIFGVSVPDANAPFRLMRSSLVQKYISRMPEDFNLPNVIFTMYFVRFCERAAFREITFRPRQGGKNFINIRKIIAIGLEAVKDFLKIKKNLLPCCSEVKLSQGR